MYPDRPQLSDAEYEKRSATNDEAYNRTKRDGSSSDVENRRELATHEIVTGKDRVKDLERYADAPEIAMGISGDALARAKKGQTPKLKY